MLQHGLQKTVQNDISDLSKLYDAESDGVFQSESSTQVSTSVLGYVKEQNIGEYWGKIVGAADKRTVVKKKGGGGGGGGGGSGGGGGGGGKSKAKVNPVDMAPKIFEKPSSAKKFATYFTKKENPRTLAPEEKEQRKHETEGKKQFMHSALHNLVNQGTFYNGCYLVIF